MKSVLFTVSLVLSITLFLQSYGDNSGLLQGKIFDKKTGEPIPARIYITGSDNEFYACEKCITWGSQGFKKTVGSSGQHSVSLNNTFQSKLPVGRTKIVIERGKEYIPVVHWIDIKKNEITPLKIEMERWIDMASMGWYSGDNHVHRRLDHMEYLMLADDLNFATVQTFWNNHPQGDNKTFVTNFLAKVNEQGVYIIDKYHQFSAIGHEIEGSPGALLYHLTDLAQAPLRGIEEKESSNAYINLSKKAHDLGGYMCIEKPFWWEAPVHLVLANPDFTQLANNHQCHEGYLPEHIYPRSELREGYPEGELGYTLFICDLYYVFLNCGYEIMPTAGSASGVLPNPAGYNRVYAKLEGEPSYNKWLSALKSGNSFVTNGPMLIITANDKTMGETLNLAKPADVEIKVFLKSSHPIKQIDLIKDGKVVQTVESLELKNYTSILHLSEPFQQSGWLTLRCFEDRDDDNTRFAHTSPIFIIVSGKPILPKRDAVEWLLNRIELLSERVMQKVKQEPEKKSEWESKLHLYQQAKEVYIKLLAQSI